MDTHAPACCSASLHTFTLFDLSLPAVAACSLGKLPRKVRLMYIFCLFSPKRLPVARPCVDEFARNSARAAVASKLIYAEQRFDTHALRDASLRCTLLHTFTVLGLPLSTAAVAAFMRRRRIPPKVAAHDVLHFLNCCIVDSKPFPVAGVQLMPCHATACSLSK